MARKKETSTKYYTVERADLYFQRKFSRAIPFLLFMALITFVFACLEGGGGPMYLLASAMFVGIAVWQYIYTSKTVVRGTEVDEVAARVCRETDIENLAWNATDTDIDDLERMEKVRLTGYTTRSIAKKTPLLRADEEDGRGRSSHLQMSRFAFGESAVEVYSLIRCLVNDDQEGETVIWKYARIERVVIESIRLSCPRAPGSQETVMAEFPVLSIYSDNKRVHRSYAFYEADRAEAEKLAAYIQNKKDTPET